MTSFDPRFLGHWRVAATTPTLWTAPGLAVYEHPSQASVELLTVDGRVEAKIGQTVWGELGQPRPQEAGELRAILANQGIRLNDPDVVFGPALNAFEALDEPTTRPLSPQDQPIFDDFAAGIDEAERDEAFVELDHWVVVGQFDGQQLVAAASAYPWRESRDLADLGVITHPDHRGRGHARTVVRALASHVNHRGLASHYRCQLDNVGSRATALAAGFAEFATWEVALEPFEL